MSGTSADGIDAALVDLSGAGRQTQARLVAFVSVPHSAAMRAAILSACEPGKGSAADLCALSFALGEKFAEAAQDVAREAGVLLDRVEAIASHGQTVWHQPQAGEVGGVRATGTLQIGEPAVIAARTGCPVISNFRAADMAAGGQGAPLVPYADWALLTSDEESRAILNIGGIANVTHLPRGAGLEEVTAFDTGPGNMIIDELVRRFTDGEKLFDEGGQWAARGDYSGLLGELILDHPYFNVEPPKTTGREQFGREFVDWFVETSTRAIRHRNLEREMTEAMLIGTATWATSASIAAAFQKWLEPRGGISRVIVSGGGAHNKTILSHLQNMLPQTRISTHAEFGIPNDAKEALAFALLGYETLHGRPSNVPSATGASRPVVLGSITSPP